MFRVRVQGGTVVRVRAPPIHHWGDVVKVVKGGNDVMNSRSIVGGHLGLGRYRANSEPPRLLSANPSGTTFAATNLLWSCVF